jgi:hypothetical protein
VQIAGADQSEYNGIHKISNVTSTTFDITVAGSPATPATGTITAKVAPLGWSKVYSGTNKGAYRGQEATGTQLYLRVDDNNPKSNSNRSALARGYESMSDVDTGSGPFPTVAQMADGIFLLKSSSADSTARPWVLVGDGFLFHLFVAHHASYSGSHGHFMFGDPASEMASDPYGCLIAGNYSDGYSSAPESSTNTHQCVSSSGITQTQTGNYFARSYTQTGSAVLFGRFSSGLAMSGASFGALGGSYPAPHNNGLYDAPILLGDGSCMRARLRSVYHPCQVRPLGHGASLPADESPFGRRLFSVSSAYSGATVGETHLDIDGPWR